MGSQRWLGIGNHDRNRCLRHFGAEGMMKVLVAILSFITVIVLLAAFVSLAAIFFGVVCEFIMVLLPECIRRMIQGD